MGIGEKLKSVRSAIDEACVRAGRDPSTVQLCAVSKFHSADDIREAYAAGQRLFGENYAQELRDKWAELGTLDGIRFHFIGRLQKNKARYVAASAEAMESLDDLELAEELDRRLDALDRTMDAFVEVNFDESQKGGVSVERVPAFLEEMKRFGRIRVKGLMAIPPADLSPDATRQVFRTLARLAADAGLEQLSMGMSHDFEIAVEEGATVVRVGTAIFGPRPVKK